MVPPSGEFVREVFSSGQAFVSGAAHGGRFRLSELFLDLVALAMSHQLILCIWYSTARVGLGTFNNSQQIYAYEYCFNQEAYRQSHPTCNGQDNSVILRLSGNLPGNHDPRPQKFIGAILLR